MARCGGWGGSAVFRREGWSRRRALGLIKCGWVCLAMYFLTWDFYRCIWIVICPLMVQMPCATIHSCVENMMGKQQFDEFINEQMSLQDEYASIDWNAKRDTWLEHVGQLYIAVEEILKDYVKSKKVKLNKDKNKDIFEDFIGKYSVKLLEIDVFERKAILEPIGMNIIGASGRVDLVGESGRVKFVLVDKHASAPQMRIDIRINGESDVIPTGNENDVSGNDLVWKISTAPPTIKYLEINQDNFFDALMEVVGG